MAVALHSRVLGEGGTPIVILHGLFGSSDNWQTIAKQLGEDYTIHLVDLRNHGRSPWASPHNYNALAEDVIHYIEHKIGQEVVLLGHSMGGKTAMNLAGKRPDLIAKLVIVDISPKYFPPHHHQYFEGMRSIPLTELKSRSAADHYLLPHVASVGVRQFLLKNLVSHRG